MLDDAFPPPIRFSRNLSAQILPSCEEMQVLEQVAIASGCSAEELMERAASQIAQALIDQKVKAPVLVLCGPGNNGGDGILVAQKLDNAGVESCVVIASSAKYSALNQKHQNARVVSRKKIFIYGVDRTPSALTALSRIELEGLVADSPTVVDALLGIGQMSAPRDSIKEIIEIVNLKAPKNIISIDTPTGINPSSGQVFDPCIKAHETFAIEFVKRGMVQYPARQSCGEIVVVPIGIPPSSSVGWRVAHEHAINRSPTVHKGTAGKVAVVGGCFEMPGAPHLTGRAALRVGAGLVSLVVPERVRVATQLETPELVYKLLTANDAFDLTNIDLIIEYLATFDAFVIGPGIGRAAQTAKFLNVLLEKLSQKEKVVVLDADALFHLGDVAKGKKRNLPKNLIVTPHSAEMARLLGISVADVEANRFAAVRELSNVLGGVAVLKGPGSLVAFPDGKSGAVCLLGNSYMATAGCGDVLAGVIAGCAAQGLNINQAAEVGVVLHARAGDAAVRERGGPIIASDVIERVLI